nr:MAG TPA: hypothetical protein [Bacteriophage sp.]
MTELKVIILYLSQNHSMILTSRILLSIKRKLLIR